jgi:hypothetical protein
MAETYVRLLDYLYLVEQILVATKPLFKTKAPSEIPEPPTRDEYRALQSRVAAFGSAEVHELLDRFSDAYRTFSVYVPTVDEVAYGEQKRDAFDKLNAARAQASLVIGEIERQVNEELRGMPGRDRWWRRKRGAPDSDTAR